MAYSVCHAPLPVTSYICSRGNQEEIAVRSKAIFTMNSSYRDLMSMISSCVSHFIIVNQQSDDCPTDLLFKHLSNTDMNEVTVLRPYFILFL